MRPTGGGEEIPRPRQVRRGPALAFVGIAAAIGVGGFAAAALSSRTPSVAPASSGRSLPGIGLAAVPATAALRPIAHGGEPPADIAGALVVPAGTARTGSACGAGVDLYDCTVHLRTQSGASDVVDFYRAELRHEGWKILAVDAAAGRSNGTEIYAQKGSSDGYYWDVGVRVESRTPAITPALSGGSQVAPTSTVSLRVFERNDPD